MDRKTRMTNDDEKFRKTRRGRGVTAAQRCYSLMQCVTAALRSSSFLVVPRHHHKLLHLSHHIIIKTWNE
jgi:hypothetical protein